MKIFLLILLVLVLLVLACGYAVFFLACVRRPQRLKLEKNPWSAPYAAEIRAASEAFLAAKPEPVSISSRDGLRLAGRFLPAKPDPADAKGTLLLMHGYRSSDLTDFALSLGFYESLGYNILLISQRTHGESEGQYITFGVKERYDAEDWAVYLCDRFGAGHRVILGGLSMGASTVMMAAALPLPANVKGIIADCGFASPAEEIIYLMRKKHIPVHPLFDIANLFARLFAKFDFREADTLSAMAQCTLPVLFVHGQDDTFVPPDNTEQNYAACAGEKRILRVKHAGHGTSYIFDKEGYQNALREFLK